MTGGQAVLITATIFSMKEEMELWREISKVISKRRRMGDPQKHSSREGLPGPFDDRMMNVIKLKKSLMFTTH